MVTPGPITSLSVPLVSSVPHVTLSIRAAGPVPRPKAAQRGMEPVRVAALA